MTLAYTPIGKGPQKVIVVNDWSQDVTSYDPIKPYLDENRFSFAFANVRGYGDSRELSGEYTAVEVVKDIAELADQLDWQQFALIGHSMSGVVVQRAMVDIPGRLTKVVATTPVPATSLRVDDDTLGFFLSMTTDDEAFKQGMAGLTSEIYGEEWANFKLECNRATVSTAAMQGYCDMWGRTDFSDEVKGLETPVLVIFGDSDIELLRSEATLAQFKEWYPNLSTHTCHCGHYPMQEVPVDYAYQVQKYLST